MDGVPSIGVGLIGCGVIGQAHALGVAKSPGARLLAVADQDRGRADAFQKRYGVASAYTEAAPLFDRRDVGAVIVCTPNDSHCPIVEAACAAGKHVMVQKPIARTVAEADRMIGAASRADRKLMVAFFELFHPAFRKAKSLIRDGVIGDVFLISATFGWHKGGTDSWKWNPTIAGGGYFMDGLIHQIASILWMTGVQWESVYAETGTLGSTAAVEDTGVIMLRAPKVIASLGGGMRLKEPSPQFGGHFKERLELFGTNGTIQILPLDRPSLRVYSDKGLLPQGMNGWMSPTLDWTPYDERSLSLHFNADEDPWVPLHRHFFRWLRDEEPAESDGAFGRQVQAIVVAAYESAKSGAVIRLPRTTTAAAEGRG
ncbi:MAG: Gfo/Idh/MocA family protein [bacterium]